MKQPRPDCPVRSYARDVVEGKIIACKWVKAACKRHLDDLNSDRGIWWDQAACDRALKFFGFVRHSKGDFAGKVFILERWQKFIIGCLFGWKRADGSRRFREAWIEIPRKNGKTQMAAAVALLLLLADFEGGAEVYSAATKRDQAKLSHGEAKRMVKASKSLKRLVDVYRDNLSVEKTNSKYEPLGADADTADGLNPSGLILDEVHAWKGRDFWDVLDTAMGARRQPLKFCITTAGADSGQETVYDEQHKYAKRVLDENDNHNDDAFFGIIYTIDDGDDWQNPKSWAKANPNLGVSVRLDYLQDKFNKANKSPASQNAFKRLYLNVRTASVDGWLPMEEWKKCGSANLLFDENELLGKECFGGLDLANTGDLAAFVLVFPWDDGYRLLCWFWCPKEPRDTRAQKLRERILAPWIDAEWIEATEGNEIDYNRIREQINTCGTMYDIKQIAFDPYNATQFAQDLAEDGFEAWKFLQRIGIYNEPCRLFERLVREGKLWHNANPVLSWMAGNVTIRQDGIGNMMPDRKRSANKIDGIPAAVMALARASLAPAETDGGFERW